MGLPSFWWLAVKKLFVAMLPGFSDERIATFTEEAFGITRALRS